MCYFVKNFPFASGGRLYAHIVTRTYANTADTQNGFGMTTVNLGGQEPGLSIVITKAIIFPTYLFIIRPSHSIRSKESWLVTVSCGGVQRIRVHWNPERSRRGRMSVKRTIHAAISLAFVISHLLCRFSDISSETVLFGSHLSYCSESAFGEGSQPLIGNQPI